MLSKLKSVTAIATIVEYLNSTSFSRKLFDFASVAILLSLIGIITGKMPLPSNWPHIAAGYYIGMSAVVVVFYLLSMKIIEINLPNKHTVENTCKVSEDVNRILLGEQYSHDDYNFVGHFRFHNGVSGVDGFNFMKFSLTEYANAVSVTVDPMTFQNLPIIINMHMVSALIDGVPYSAGISPQSPMYLEMTKLGIQTYTAVAVKSKQGLLSGFVYVGSKTEHAPDADIVKRIAEKVQAVGTR